MEKTAAACLPSVSLSVSHSVTGVGFAFFDVANIDSEAATLAGSYQGTV